MSIITVLVMSISVSCAPVTPSSTSVQTGGAATTPAATTNSQAATTTPATRAELPVPEEQARIRVEKIEGNLNAEEAGLYEITDKIIIARISEMIPDSQSYLDQSETQPGAALGEVFQAIIPLELDLVTAKEIADGAKGMPVSPAILNKYALLFKNNVQNIRNPAAYFKAVGNIYSLALFIADFYLMDRSNAELELMEKDVQKISDFQDREFKSRIMSAHSDVKEMSEFTSEIIGNEEARNLKLHKLEELKYDVTQLLDQVNVTITDTVGQEEAEFQSYVESIESETILIQHQDILTSLLEEISNLMFVLSKGNLSRELSFSAYNNYIAKSNEARAKLSRWHNDQIDQFGIDLVNKKFSKQGIEAFFSAIPGVFNKDWKKKELDDAFVQKIIDQTREPAYVAGKPRVLPSTHVTIIIMNGKYYLLPSQQA